MLADCISRLIGIDISWRRRGSTIQSTPLAVSQHYLLSIYDFKPPSIRYGHVSRLLFAGMQQKERHPKKWTMKMMSVLLMRSAILGEPSKKQGVLNIFVTICDSANANSLLMRTLVKNCPLSSSENSLMTSDQLRAMGDLAFTQLAELRHRGAFSAVSQTFTICCVRCNTGSGATRSTLEDWYQVRMRAYCISVHTLTSAIASSPLYSESDCNQHSSISRAAISYGRYPDC